jgi:hypothetical protein
LQKAMGKAWRLKHTTTEAHQKAGRRSAKGNFSGVFALVLVTTYGELDGLNTDFANDESFGK